MSFESGLSKVGRILDKLSQQVKKFARIFFVDRSHSSRKVQSGGISPYYILVFDSFVAFLSIFISIHLRIGMDFLDYSPLYIVKNMLVFGLVSSSVFLWFQTYQSFWKYTSVEDVVPVFLSVIVSNVIFFPLMMLMNQEDFLPYSVLIINVFVLAFMLLIPRFTARILYNSRISRTKKMEHSIKIQRNFSDTDQTQVLLVGNPSSVDLFLREFIENDEVQFDFKPVGILSIDQEDIGRAIRGIPIIGTVKQISLGIRNLSREGVFPKQILVTDKHIPEPLKKFLISFGQNHGLLLMHVLHQYTLNTVTE